MKQFVSIIILLLLISTATVSFSQIDLVKRVSKTIVVPDDYSTIVSAISNANTFDTILIKNGVYEGPINQTIVINKSLFIIGENIEDIAELTNWINYDFKEL